MTVLPLLYLLIPDSDISSFGSWPKNFKCEPVPVPVLYAILYNGSGTLKENSIHVKIPEYPMVSTVSP
jgi:hypothetical protein